MPTSVQSKLDQVAPQTEVSRQILPRPEGKERQSICMNTLVGSLPEVLAISLWFYLPYL